VADGDAKITISGDATSLKSASNEANAALNKVASTAKSAGAAGEKMAGWGEIAKKAAGAVGLGGLAEAAEKAVFAFKGLASATGPVGVAILALVTALGYLYTKLRAASEETKKLEETSDAAAKKVDNLKKALLGLELTGTAKAIEELREAEKANLDSLIAKLQQYGWTTEAIEKVRLVRLKESADTLEQIFARQKKIAEEQKKESESAGRFDLIKKIEIMKAQLRGDEAKARAEDEFKLLEIQRQILNSLSEDRKKLLREEYELQRKLNAEAAEDRQKEREKEAAENKKELDAATAKELEARKKAARELVEYEAKLREDMLGSLHGDLGGIEYSGRGSVTNWGSER